MKKLILRIFLNLLLVMAVMMVTRWVFFLENAGLFTHSSRAYWQMFLGGLRFDWAAVMYANALWLLMVFFPLRRKEGKGFWLAQKITFVVLNSLLVLANLCDTVFFPFRQVRTTAAIFTEFDSDSNVMGIVLGEALKNWPLVLLFIALVALLSYGYRRPYVQTVKKYYLKMSLGLVFSALLFLTGSRGFSTSGRPMKVTEAQRYAQTPSDAAVVLNTPFTILRTFGHDIPVMPKFFHDDRELASFYSPLHVPGDSVGNFIRKNVVVIIFESLSWDFSGYLNPGLQGYTPNLDSIMAKSLRFERSFSNAGISVDAMPALLASIPRGGDPWVTGVYAQNNIHALPEILAEKGYETAFFHGAHNYSMGFHDFTAKAGFKKYFGRTEYCADPMTGGMNDDDGTWGIWDEEFLQFSCREISKLQQPFFGTIFTASSHHPYVVPERYVKKFPMTGESAQDMEQAIRYADMALGEFFRAAAAQPWFENTVFVISADHAYNSPTRNSEFSNDFGKSLIPIAFYDPSGEHFPAGVHSGSIQQIDVMPTLLNRMGYGRPFFAFGRDALDPNQRQWAFRWNWAPQIIMGDYLLQMNVNDWKPARLFNIAADPTLEHNLINTLPEVQEPMDSMLRAVVQSFQTLQKANRISDNTY